MGWLSTHPYVAAVIGGSLIGLGVTVLGIGLDGLASTKDMVRTASEALGG